MFFIPPARWQGRSCTVCLITLLFILSAGGIPVNAALNIEPLRLSLNPPSSVSGEDCGHNPVPAPSSGRPGGRSGPVEESEHRPVPKRTYHLNDLRRLAVVQAFVRRPDGSVIKPELHLGVNPGLSFNTPMGDGPVHGANSVYVVEQGVENNLLLVRTAKWITMHHNCGWGHDGKFDETKTNPQPLGSIPFEIVINKLWDPNFHASVTSGDKLIVTVLSYGKPVPGARVSLSTEKGWSKQIVTDENGRATLQLIRDYYPSSWTEFHRSYRGKFLVTAQYDVDQNGSYQDKPYKRISYITTLPWKYSPSRQDYSSYTYGLLIGTLSLTVSGIGVYAYRERRRKPYKRISFDE
ncbi:MAG: hypothetical protein OEM01_03145 [Desulfobulbaceae bacterium]|nr:hypothetical protein [Desulfobulbaceae bacterium]